MASPFGRTGRPVCGCLQRLAWQQARRELAIAHVFATGVRLAPMLDDKQMWVRYCAEELEHFERAAALRDELGGDSPVADLPVESTVAPGSWLETVVAAYLLDQACCAQLRTYAVSPDAVLRRLADSLLVEERDHVDAGGATLRALAGHCERWHVQAHADVWLPRALASLDSPSGADPCSFPHANAETHRTTVEMFLASVAELFSPLGLEHRSGGTNQPAGATRAPGAAPIARALQRDSLRRLTDERTFELGLNSSETGRVPVLDRRGDCLLATVRGKRDHAVAIWLSGDTLAYSCDCPTGAARTCCEHVVAVGLSWLGKSEH